MNLATIILAAGQGKRMVSDCPKVLHPIGGKPILGHVLDTVKTLQPQQTIVVYGHGGDAVQAAYTANDELIWVEQPQQLGTGHAVKQTFTRLLDDGVALILFADVPLIQSISLEPVIHSARQGRLALLTVELSNPQGYGRIVRDAKGQVQRIVEDKDADDEEKKITEINTGILAAPVHRLRDWVNRLDNDNAQQEYYLTDIIAMAVAEGIPVSAFTAGSASEVQGINNRIQLAELERCYQQQQTRQLMLNGATLLDPARVDIRGKVKTGKDVVIDVNVIFEGDVSLGDRVHIGPNTIVSDSVIGADSQILASCILEQVQIDRQVTVGPFARLRPGTHLNDKAKVGNFVETKNATLGTGSKASHLSYLGDSDIGNNVNIGAGTITCNYDGANKHKTVIEDDVFIGSNSALVAPIHIGAGSTVGAGSTISKHVPEHTLALTRAPAKQVKGWQRPVKKPKAGG